MHGSQTLSFKPPDYPVHFSCIGSACEDVCCNLDVPLSREEYERYSALKSAGIRSLVSQFVSIESVGADPGSYARLTRRPSGLCGFYTQQRLCAIQSECGESYLPEPCFLYPRVLNRVEGVLEGSLHLSCPEATRQVLFSENLLGSTTSSGLARFDRKETVDLKDRLPGTPPKPYHAFSLIREVIVQQIVNRSQPLWKRLLMVGALCEGLDRSSAGQFDTSFFKEWPQKAEQQLALVVVEQAPSHIAIRLELFFDLTASQVQEASVSPHFQDVFWQLIEGIGAESASSSANDLSRFMRNEQSYYRPFLERNPPVLENYLLNYVFKNLFPFGRTDTLRLPFSSFFNECLLMASQFAWLDTLLIGTSGSHGEKFAAEHLVQVVQSFSRIVEHDPATLLEMLTAVRQRGLDSLAGTAVLLGAFRS